MAAEWKGRQSEEPGTEEEDREVTPVGRAPQDLLELASTGDQNTRAYQAPQELLELARRQQAAKRAQGTPSLPVAASLRNADGDAAPPRLIGESLPPRDRPTRRPARSERLESSTPSISVAPASSSLEAIDSADSYDAPEGSVNDAAPSVARSRPSRLSEGAEAPVSSSPASLSDLALAASDRDAPPSTAAPSPSAAAAESAATSSLRGQPGQRLPVAALAVIVGICLAIGFILAKWRGLDHLFPRH